MHPHSGVQKRLFRGLIWTSSGLIFDMMKHLSILVPDGQSNMSTVACIVGAFEFFTDANGYRRKSGKNGLFTIDLVGASEKSEVLNGLVTIKPTKAILSVNRTDLIIVPSSLIRNYENATPGNQQLMDWLNQQSSKGTEIASMCTGAFTLAAAGLLDGRNCSTHWAVENNFKSLYPKVNMQTERLIIDENGICTNGGAYSFLNLLIYLVEKYYDKETAIYCSKIFQVEIDRQSQSTFSIFNGQKQHNDEVIREAQQYIEGNAAEKLSVEHLSARFAVGRRHFDRRFIKATGNTPLEYMQRVKIETAKRAFEGSNKTVNEVMYGVGYSDQKAFREVFRKVTGLSPLEYRTRYNKNA